MTTDPLKKKGTKVVPKKTKTKSKKVQLPDPDSEYDSDISLVSEVETKSLIDCDPNNTLEIRTSQSSSVKILFDTIKDLLLKTDINLIFTPEGIKIFEKDGTDTVRIHLNLNSIAFEYFHCQDKMIKVGINCEEFNKIIKTCVAKVDTIFFIVNKYKPNFFKIRFENSADSNIREYELVNIDVPYIHEIVPIVEFSSSITLPSVKLQKYIKDLNSLGTDIKLLITCVDQQLKFTCDGNFSKNTITIGKNDNNIFSEEGDQVVQGEFVLKFLALFTKATSLSTIVTIHIRNDFPLVLEYSVGSLGQLNCIINQNKYVEE